MKGRSVSLAATALALALTSAPASAAWENWLQVERFQLGPTGKVVIYTKLNHQCGGKRLETDATVTADANKMLFDLLLAYKANFYNSYFHAFVVGCDGSAALFTHIEAASGSPPTN